MPEPVSMSLLAAGAAKGAAGAGHSLGAGASAAGAGTGGTFSSLLSGLKGGASFLGKNPGIMSSLMGGIFGNDQEEVMRQQAIASMLQGLMSQRHNFDSNLPQGNM